MATRPQPFEKMPNPPSEMRSGDLGSSLDAAVGKGVKMSPDRMWARDFITAIPQNLLEKATNFVESGFDGMSASNIAHELLDEIKSRPRGVVGASDQEIALDDCIRAVKNRHIH